MIMWYAVDKDGTRALYANKPRRVGCRWIESSYYYRLEDGAQLILDNMWELSNRTWNDEPIKLDLNRADTKNVDTNETAATKKAPTFTQRLKAALKSALALVLVAIFYVVYIPFGIMRAVVDLDRFSDFADALMEMAMGFRTAWFKAIRKMKGGKE